MNSPETILKYSFCYFTIFILTWISKLNESNRLFNTKGILAANTGYLIGLHLAGILLFGLVPLTIFNQSNKLILEVGEIPTLSWLLSFILLIILTTITGLRSGEPIEIKQQYKNGSSKIFLIQYFPIRILFLCSYELFFRGFLLFDLIKWLGILQAVLITTGLTVLIHVFTNKKEMWACIPFGILLSIFCITINSVWPAILIHLILSLSYEIPPVNQFLNQLKHI